MREPSPHHNTVGGRAHVGTVVQAAEIGELHQHHHHYAAPDSGTHLTARQLPPLTRCFENRDREQTDLLTALERHTPDDRRAFVAALSGVAGVGKTTLGVRLAHRLATTHGHAVRYTDLDDHRVDGGVDVAEVLGDLICSLGVDPAWVKKGLSARVHQYEERTGEIPLVLVLDNVRSGTELRQLLPASPGSVVIAISRGRLHDIKGGADLELALGPLDAGHGRRLLERIANGDPRLTAESAVAAELLRACAGLPAALEVAAGRLRKHPARPLRRLVGRLTSEWKENGVPEVEAVWNAAYDDLSAPAALLYRLLPVHPGPYVTPEAAAALLSRAAARDPDAIDDALDELVNASLLAPGRGGAYRMHDLLRDHARRRALRDDPDDTEAAEARRRVVRWYLRQAQRADALWAGRPRLVIDAETASALPGVPDVEWTEKIHALHWLEDHRHALFAAVQVAYRNGMDHEAWALCEPLWTHFLDHQHYTDVIDAFRTGRDAARRAGNVAALVRMRCQLARPLWELKRFDEAEAETEAALAAVGLLGGDDLHRKLAASVSEFRGKVHAERGRWAEAVPYFEASRRVHEEIGNPYGAMLQTYLIGRAAHETGDLASAVRLLREAHATAAGLKRARMTARTGFQLARALHEADARAHADEARGLYEAALASARERGATREQVTVLEALAALADAGGDQAAAHRHRASAAAIRARATGEEGHPPNPE
ncbi:tetratricopeptide repeat protein [Streptomyces sp. TRM64462]|uniref:tetratricopeptide repeat protein n=1 Tax=Streptomyces sp. TRM64462 TaxID=2741726 RepID=UPI002814A20A|nr:tetratricopeptide repeat protein [Streptomyces sp. TRM64462]